MRALPMLALYGLSTGLACVCEYHLPIEEAQEVHESDDGNSLPVQFVANNLFLCFSPSYLFSAAVGGSLHVFGCIHGGLL